MNISEKAKFIASVRHIERFSKYRFTTPKSRKSYGKEEEEITTVIKLMLFKQKLKMIISRLQL